jgi:hypothetical protein
MRVTCPSCNGKKGIWRPNHQGGLDFFPCGPCGGNGWVNVPDPPIGKTGPGPDSQLRRPPPWVPPLRDPAFPLVGRWLIEGGCLDIFPPTGGGFPVKEWGEIIGQSGEGQAYGEGNQVKIELTGGPGGRRVYSLTFVSDRSMTGTSSMWGLGIPISMQR